MRYANASASPSPRVARSIGSGSSACTISSPSNAAISVAAAPSCSSSSDPNSSTPDGHRKHLNPNTPASWSSRRCPRSSGTAPPQNPTSTWALPSAADRFSASASTVVVGGMLFSGMSRIVVTPPAAAARVAVSNPSHSVRPGSFTCTWVSTTPGRITRSPASISGTPEGTSSNGATRSMRPSATWMHASRTPSGVTTRRPRNRTSAPYTVASWHGPERLRSPP